MSLTKGQDQVVLVDRNDEPIGAMEKLHAHRLGVLHRAFSVFVFNGAGELLLQRRATDKYHSGGLWTNTCCSHPRPGETVEEAAHRRLQEEMGLTCTLQSPYSFIYRSTLDRGLIEHELDHVFVGYSETHPTPDPREVSEWRYVSVVDIREELAADEQRFTSWFRICFERTALLVLSMETELQTQP